MMNRGGKTRGWFGRTLTVLQATAVPLRTQHVAPMTGSNGASASSMT
jgi:hypothetical protein